MTTTDPTRSPEGTESAWAYTHVPRGVDWTREAVDAHVQRIEDAVERVAPGFAATALARHVQSPPTCRRPTPTSSTARSTPARRPCTSSCSCGPTPGLGRPETPVPGLYLASASAHPGGGVHGACGWNAARSALASSGAPASSRTRWSAPRGGGCSRTDRAATATGHANRPRLTAGLGGRPPRPLPSPRRARPGPRAASAGPTARARPRPRAAAPARCRVRLDPLPRLAAQPHQRRHQHVEDPGQEPEAEHGQRVGHADRVSRRGRCDRAHDGPGHLLRRVHRRRRPPDAAGVAAGLGVDRGVDAAGRDEADVDARASGGPRSAASGPARGRPTCRRRTSSCTASRSCPAATRPPPAGRRPACGTGAAPSGRRRTVPRKLRPAPGRRPRRGRPRTGRTRPRRRSAPPRRPGRTASTAAANSASTAAPSDTSVGTTSTVAPGRRSRARPPQGLAERDGEHQPRAGPGQLQRGGAADAAGGAGHDHDHVGDVRAGAHGWSTTLMQPSSFFWKIS